jgi:hypothetical protein
VADFELGSESAVGSATLGRNSSHRIPARNTLPNQTHRGKALNHWFGARFLDSGNVGGLAVGASASAALFRSALGFTSVRADGSACFGG